VSVNLPIFVDDLTRGIDNKKTREKRFFEIMIILERGSYYIDAVSLGNLTDRASFVAGDVNGDLFDHLFDRIAMIMRVRIEGDELVGNMVPEIWVAHRGMNHFGDAREVIYNVLPVETLLDPRLNNYRRIFIRHNSS